MTAPIDINDAIRTLRAAGYKITAPGQRKATAGDGWADYDANSVANKRIAFPSPVMCMAFADGEKTRMSFATVAGKPLNVARGARLCKEAYLFRVRNRKRKATGEALADHIASLVDLEAIRTQWVEASQRYTEAEDAMFAWERDNPRPSLFDASRADVQQWEAKREEFTRSNGDLLRIADALRKQYRDSHEAAEAAFMTNRLAVTIPAVTDCHVELEGEQVATFDAAAVNARLGLVGDAREAA